MLGIVRMALWRLYFDTLQLRAGVDLIRALGVLGNRPADRLRRGSLGRSGASMVKRIGWYNLRSGRSQELFGRVSVGF
jgi:hypothetical protein